MRVFLDTNIFYNNWFMQNANFKYLFNWISNENHTLLISNLVIEEAENIRNRELREALSDLKKNIRTVNKLHPYPIDFDTEKLGIQPYDLKSLLKTKSEYVEIIEYEDISHNEVVSRALSNRKPFLESEKGYRDTLIWLSFLRKIASSNYKDDVIFITENKSDFFKKNAVSTEFHDDLADDIKNFSLPAKIIPFASLFSFINSFVDQNANAINHYASEDIFQGFIYESSTEYIEAMNHTKLASFIGSSVFDFSAKEILGVRFEVFDGIEDASVIKTSRLDGNDIYVSYSYNLKNSFLEIIVPETDYLFNKGDFDDIVDDVELESDTTKLIFYIRPYFEVSFIYNDKIDSLKNFEVSKLWLKR